MAKKATKKKSTKKKATKKAASSSKPKSAPAKEKSNGMTWLVVIVVIALLFFLIRGCSGTEEMVEPVVDDTPVVEEEDAGLPETTPGEALTADDVAQGAAKSNSGYAGEVVYKDNSLAIDTNELERVSNVACSQKMISIKLTNVNDEKSYMISNNGVQKGFDTYFQVRGIVVKNPGCDAEELAPGESTMCTSIGQPSGSYMNIEGTNRLSVVTPNDEGLSRTEAVLVNC